MDWRDKGTLLNTRRHGETSAIIEVFTQDHGRHAGVVRGGASRKIAPLLQPGAQLDVTWRARLDEHLGSFSVELDRSRAADVMSDRLALAALNSVTAILSFCLPERESHPALYARTMTLLDMLGTSPAWALAYLRWELAVLEDMGFGLDLTSCAVTGTTDDLIFVSPKTGRAVSKGAAGQWAGQLLPLPPSLLGEGNGDLRDVAEGLVTTGHFLKTRLAPELGNRPLPDARQRLIDRISKAI